MTDAGWKNPSPVADVPREKHRIAGRLLVSPPGATKARAAGYDHGEISSLQIAGIATRPQERGSSYHACHRATEQARGCVPCRAIGGAGGAQTCPHRARRRGKSTCIKCRMG